MTAAAPEGHGQGDGRQRPDDGRAADDPPSRDPLVAARIALEDVDRLPLDQRAEVFERVHSTVVDELRQLEHG